MTAPLYDIKARFSEYVSIAENGEVVIITKHSIPTAVIMSIAQYNEYEADYEARHRPSFMEKVRKWREETGGLTQDEAEEYCNTLERLVQEDKKYIDNGVNPWD